MTHKNIYMALAAAQAEMGPAKKNAANPHFKSKYADLAEVVAAARPALTKHGICFYHVPEATEFGRYMVTVLAHGESGTEIRCPVELIIGKPDVQGYKSATTYAKRIGLDVEVADLSPLVPVTSLRSCQGMTVVFHMLLQVGSWRSVWLHFLFALDVSISFARSGHIERIRLIIR